MASDPGDIPNSATPPIEDASTGIDLPALIQACTAAQTGAAEARGIALRTDIDPLLPARVRGDAAALTLVLDGLFTTILKAPAIGGILLRVRRNGYGSRGPHLLFRVEAPTRIDDGRSAEARTAKQAPVDSGLPSDCRVAAMRLGGMIGVDLAPGGGLVGWCEIEMAEGGFPPPP